MNPLDCGPSWTFAIDPYTKGRIQSFRFKESFLNLSMSLFPSLLLFPFLRGIS